MPVFEWQRKPSTKFGEVWVPIAVIQLQTERATFSSVLACVDSGAVISLLRRSLADELGIRLEDGRRIELTSVGGSHTDAYMHVLPVRFTPSQPAVSVPFAIAASEQVPNLLGRSGLFDQFEITFDPRRRATRIEPIETSA